MEELEERIREMEENIETSSFDIRAEKEVCVGVWAELKERRKIQEMAKQLESLKTYATAQSEIDAMRTKRDAGQKRKEEINQRLDELTNTIGVSEAILRIKELTGVEVWISSFSSPPASCEQDHDDERVDSLDESGSHLRQEPAERIPSSLSRR